MFIGRERELDALNKLYKSNKFEFAVIYGRRRVGKTALINEFIGEKKAIYFMGVESNAKQNLENFSKSIMEFASGIETESSFLSFQAALEYVFKLAENERIILAIDEYPYVARSSKSLASTLQLLIDKYKDTSKLMLILCGSSMSYMEDHVLAYKAPLYGRRTAQMKLLPFDFDETCRYFKNLSDEDKALIYGVAGGTPQYLLQMDDKLSVEDNIKNTYLNPISFLYEEPTNLLKQEVREPAIYTAIITAIATGSSRMSEISRDLKLLAMESKKPFVVLHQLNRANTDRKDKRPILSDLRDSGKIEQDADIIGFVYRPAYYDDTRNKSLMQLIIAKNRHGQNDVVCELKFNPVTQKISENYYN